MVGPPARPGLAASLGEVRFAKDSVLEGAGFEPSVPLVRPVPEWLEKGSQSFLRMVSRDACAPVKCAGGIAILTIEWLDGPFPARARAKQPGPSVPSRMQDLGVVP